LNQKSTICRPSASVSTAPSPDCTNGAYGLRRKASRVKPPGKTVCASAKSAADLGVSAR